MGKIIFKRPQYYHPEQFRFIYKWSLPEISKMADALRISVSLLL